MRKATTRALLTSVLWACSTTPALADQWLPAQTTVIETADHGARLTIVPRPIDSPLGYFSDKAEGKPLAGATAGTSAKTAMASLETRDAAGRWTLAWTRPLQNDVAPVDAVLANEAQGFVTFDNWHAMGYGPDAIAVYDAGGKLVRALSLEQVLPPWFVAVQAHTVSSIWWRDKPRLAADGKSVIVPVALPQPDDAMDGPTLDLAIRLADGAVLGLDEPAWQTALGQAAALAHAACRQELSDSAKWNAPIAAPMAGEQPAWHQYLREIVFRDPKTPIANPGFPDTVVLMPPGHKDHASTVAALETLLAEKSDKAMRDVRMIGSPDMVQLVVQIERIAARLEPGRLKGVDLVVVVDASGAKRVARALAASRANLRFVDPQHAIPQRPDRMVSAVRDSFPACLAPPAPALNN